MSEERGDLTQLLAAASSGDRDAVGALLPVIYDELRRRASGLLRKERTGHTLQPTALVHEAFVQLFHHQPVDWTNRAHFFAVAAQAMRRILVDHARGRMRSKRGGDVERVSLDAGLGLSIGVDADVVAIDDALQALALVDARQAEIVELRFFGGLSVDEVAAVLKVSKRTIEGEWTMIKAWLRKELGNA